MGKYLMLEVNRENWGLTTLDDWQNVFWKVYSDGAFLVQIGFGAMKTPDDFVQKSGIMRRDLFAKLCEAMDQDWSSEYEVDGCDGEAWAFRKYSPEGGIVKNSDLGYIDDNGPLGRIVKCLPGKSFVRDNNYKL